MPAGLFRSNRFFKVFFFSSINRKYHCFRLFIRRMLFCLISDGLPNNAITIQSIHTMPRTTAKRRKISRTDGVEGKNSEQNANSFFAFLKRFFGRFDLFQIVPLLLLLFIGCTFIYGAGQQVGGNFAEIFWKRQILYACVGLMAWLILVFMDYRWLGPLSILFYPLALASLVFVLVHGVTLSGGKQWIQVGGITFQPSEFAKLALIISISWILSMKKANVNHFLWMAAVLLLSVVPIILILKEPDFGTSAVLIPVIGSIAFVSNLKWRYIVIVLVILSIAAPFAYYQLKPYQRDRIITFLDPEKDPLNRGWSAIQSEIAVGSGGFSGKGYMQGTHCSLGYLPRTVAHSDFIFPVIAEETGFIGSIILLALFALLQFSIFRTALMAPDAFGRNLCVGIGMLIMVHVFVNVGMCIRMVPITGLPLPLVSYGGTFLVTILICLGIVQSVYSHRTKESFLDV